MFGCQSTTSIALIAAAASPCNTVLGTSTSDASTRVQEAEKEVNDVDIVTINMICKFQDLDESTICQSNKYYSMYGTELSVKNLPWSGDKTLDSCKDSLRNKARESFVRISLL